MKVNLVDLTKSFPARGKKSSGDVLAVDDFTFEIADGELVGLLGPSGCGKTTALNLISGLLSPTGGKILFDGEDVTGLPPEVRGVGLVFQNYALYPHLTVLQNILFPLQNQKGAQRLSKQEMLARTRETARLVQIEELFDRKPRELSGGQQQRVAIARALVRLPRILLLDEPLSNLDARLRLQTREELRRIQRETRITTVFVTHDQEEAMSISDTIVVMNSGIIEQIGKPQEVYDDPRNLFVAKFLGTPPINELRGDIRDSKLYINGDCIFSVRDINGGIITNQAVTAGIRPEGFGLQPSEGQGLLRCSLRSIEVLGRDISCVCTNESAAGLIRAIVSSAESAYLGPHTLGDQTVSFSLKPEKVLLFKSGSGERLPFAVIQAPET